MDFINGNYVRLATDMLNSDYYTWVLSATDKVVFQTLMRSILHKGSDSYKNGLLVTNIKRKTLVRKTGIGSTAIRDSILHLDTIGALILLPEDKYTYTCLLGFRARNNDWLYFIYHLIEKYEDIISEYIDTKIKETNYKVRDIAVDADMFSLSASTRKFITENYTDTEKLFSLKNKDNKKLFDVLFNRKDYHAATNLVVLK